MLRLHKALYGLRQAPRAWNAKLDVTLEALGFTRSDSEHAVYAAGRVWLACLWECTSMISSSPARMKVRSRDSKVR